MGALFERRVRGVAGTGSVRLRFADYDPSLVVPAGAAIIGAAAVAAFVAGWHPQLLDVGGRAAIETAIGIAAAASAVLLMGQYRRRRHVYPLLLMGAVVTIALTGVAFSALPALLGGHRGPLGGSAAIAVRALVPLAVAEAAVFLAAGVAFVRRGPATSTGGCLLGGASFLLAAARLQAIAIPVVAGDYVTPRDLMRLAAYALVLTAVIRDQSRISRAAGESALRVQREEIARDLHDGLAQDLAVIAFHGQRMEAELGAGHPVTVAARRALATSRHAIVDLSASHAPTTIAALSAVADELAARFGIEISVHDEVQRPAGLEADLRARAREQFVRVAREAIVNAARHGAARHVDVTLATRGPGWLLTIADDGSGIPQSQLVCSSGFGLRAIRARAEELGGRFSAGPGVAGGTVLELSLAGSGDA
jgi:signal transduction histidine kinase